MGRAADKVVGRISPKRARDLAAALKMGHDGEPAECPANPSLSAAALSEEWKRRFHPALSKGTVKARTPGSDPGGEARS